MASHSVIPEAYFACKMNTETGPCWTDDWLLFTVHIKYL